MMKQLFFLPFAGANINSYNPLMRALSNEYECTAIELPGRGSQFGVKLLETVPQMAEYCVTQISKKRNGASWGLFGHSLGAVLAALVGSSPKTSSDLPDWIVLSGRAAPGINVSKTVRHELTKNELFDDLRSLGGLEPEILDHPELLDLIEPILRADFKAIETFDFSTFPLLKVPILVLGGSQDCIELFQLKAWESFTTSTCKTVLLDGGHFFIYQQVNTIIELIRDMNKTSL